MSISAKVYSSDNFSFPHLAVIIDRGEVVFAKPVGSAEEGDRLLGEMLAEYMERAAREGRKI